MPTRLSNTVSGTTMPTPRSRKDYPESDLYPPEFAAWQQKPNVANTRALRQTLMPQVKAALTSYAGGDPTLQVAAHLEVGKALKTYDPKKGVKLKNHVFHRLQVLQRVSADRNETLHVPERLRILRQRMASTEEEFEDARGRPPSAAEVAAKMSLSEVQVSRIRRLPKERAQRYAEGEKGDLLAPSETSDQTDLDDIKAYVYHDLSPTNQKVFEWTTGWNGSKVLPKGEIARRLKVSPGAISQRISTISSRFSDAM